MDTTREEHLEFCKKRALEYLDQGEITNAITSMLSDLSKHDETDGVGKAMSSLGMMEMINPSIEGARRFIVGFN